MYWQWVVRPRLRVIYQNKKKWKTRGTQEYIELTAQRCLNSMQEVQPLSSESDDRLTYKDFSSSNYQIKQDSV